MKTQGETVVLIEQKSKYIVQERNNLSVLITGSG